MKVPQNRRETSTKGQFLTRWVPTLRNEGAEKTLFRAKVFHRSKISITLHPLFNESSMNSFGNKKTR